MHGWTEEDVCSLYEHGELEIETFPEIAYPYDRLIKRLTWLDRNGGSDRDGKQAILDYFDDMFGQEVSYLLDRLPIDC